MEQTTDFPYVLRIYEYINMSCFMNLELREVSSGLAPQTDLLK